MLIHEQRHYYFQCWIWHNNEINWCDCANLLRFIFLFVPRGGSRGAGDPLPLFLAKSILFFTFYTMSEKYFWNWILIYSDRNPRSFFGSVGVYACVCVSVWSHRPTLQISRFLSNIGWFRNRGRYCFFVLQRPNFEWYPTPIWSQKYMPDCRKSRLIFFKFSGGGPQTPRRRSRLRRSFRGFAPLQGPLSKIPGSAPGTPKPWLAAINHRKPSIVLSHG